jgi:hypothetical protein
VGVLRCAALALVAPLLVIPATASDAASASAVQPTHHRPHADGVARTSPPSRVTALRAPASVRLLAARVYWGAAPPAYPTTRAARADLDRTASYFRRISRGAESFHVTLTHWVHVRASAATMCSRQGASARIARRALARAGYRPQHFDRLMLLTEQCNAAVSVAQQPGQVSWIRYRNPGMSTLVHELGHNLGLAHAYGVVCRMGALRVPLGGRCHSVEYGDSWDAMGHSNASFSVPVLSRLGWAGAVATASTSGSYRLADVEHPGRALQGVRVPVGGRVTYWVEYQPEHSTTIGRSIPGVIIRRQVRDGRVEIVDASPGNPAEIAFPDPDLSNPALPAGSSITTPEGVRLTTVSVGRTATVEVRYGQEAGAPAAPEVSDATLLAGGRYRVHWRAPADNGQIVLGYQVTAQPSGAVTFVRSPGAYRTSAVLAVGRHAGDQTFTVQAVNQAGWSVPSSPEPGQRPVERQGRSLSPAT